MNRVLASTRPRPHQLSAACWECRRFTRRRPVVGDGDSTPIRYDECSSW